MAAENEWFYTSWALANDEQKTLLSIHCHLQENTEMCLLGMVQSYFHHKWTILSLFKYISKDNILH